jgi:hypothetical protein
MVDEVALKLLHFSLADHLAVIAPYSSYTKL